jgi:hypothetical protein
MWLWAVVFVLDAVTVLPWQPRRTSFGGGEGLPLTDSEGYPVL